MQDQTKRDRLRDALLRQMAKGARVAEIGVWEGAFSQRILGICEPSELHLIDPWLYQPEFANTGFGRKKNEDLMEQKYRDVVAQFAGDARVKVHRAMSDVGLAVLPDRFLIDEGITGIGQLSVVPPWLALGSLAFAAFIGIAAGLYPAARAARLDPVAALRHE